ncbi:hypothetical protein QAD02_000027 [Eretmocerus hayati]|uniref:Uncharacterized protein n=1 Tax=Eretmocerus hayati TaxID=131215 RepID=A0ACC2NCF2_9HYME|nr:hypothetical protein QAD02_000027 [Eretmocerus hayati]
MSGNSSVERNGNTADSGHHTERAGALLSAPEIAKFTQTIWRLVKKHPDHDIDPKLMKLFDAMEIRIGDTSEGPTASARHNLERHSKSNGETLSARTNEVDATTAPKYSGQDKDNSTENEIDGVGLDAVEEHPPRANLIEESMNDNSSSASSRSASSIPSTRSSSSGSLVASITTPPFVHRWS